MTQREFHWLIMRKSLLVGFALIGPSVTVISLLPTLSSLAGLYGVGSALETIPATLLFGCPIGLLAGALNGAAIVAISSWYVPDITNEKLYRVKIAVACILVSASIAVLIAHGILHWAGALGFALVAAAGGAIGSQVVWRLTRESSIRRIGKLAINSVLFDLDGTLVHTRIDFAQMRADIRKLAVEAGVPENLLGDEILEAVDKAAGYLGGMPGASLKQRMWSTLEEREREGCSNPSLISGAAALLSRLRRWNIKIAIVTRNCRSVSIPLLGQFALPHDALLTRDDVAKAKPDPDHLLAALRAIGGSPETSVMVGDHWLDIRAGQEAGCAATIGVLGQERPPSWFDKCPPTYVVRDLGEALKLFH